MKTEKLIKNIIQWADDRNLIEGSYPIAQLKKTLEEVGELMTALNSMDSSLSVKDKRDDPLSYYEARNHAIDGYGDILVTLIIGLTQCGFTVDECLEQAWNEIKDRKGKLINGVFVKDA